jgi:hypothetical protein
MRLFWPTIQKGGHMLQPLGKKNFLVDLKCAWKGKGSKLLTPITSNKTERESNKNMETKP